MYEFSFFICTCNRMTRQTSEEPIGVADPINLFGNPDKDLAINHVVVSQLC